MRHVYRVEILVGDHWVDVSGLWDTQASALDGAALAAQVVRSRSARVVSPEGYTTDVYHVQ